ncbi:hypothetical protein ON010_g96 [Phytophthora cinnamomi]|nr:hypothetical protein ON010_g96 [Phytophthora cinnamomi]
MKGVFGKNTGISSKTNSLRKDPGVGAALGNESCREKLVKKLLKNSDIARVSGGCGEVEYQGHEKRQFRAFIADPSKAKKQLRADSDATKLVATMIANAVTMPFVGSSSRQ